jgi:hypothetical protein
VSFCDIKPITKRDEIIEKLKEREADLRAQGVAHARGTSAEAAFLLASLQ